MPRTHPEYSIYGLDPSPSGRGFFDGRAGHTSLCSRGDSESGAQPVSPSGFSVADGRPVFRAIECRIEIPEIDNHCNYEAIQAGIDVDLFDSSRHSPDALTVLQRGRNSLRQCCCAFASSVDVSRANAGTASARLTIKQVISACRAHSGPSRYVSHN